jgi:hypothetical protein
LERGSGACQSRNSSQRVCDSVTAAHTSRSRRSDCAMRPRLADAPPAGLPTPAPSHTPTTCSGSAHRCVQASDGRARRRRSTAPGRTAACTSAPALGPPSPPHNTVVVCRGEGTGRSTAAHPAEARCATPPLRPPVHAQRAAPATPSSTPAWGAPSRVEE